jgi:hypothetical protein
MSNLSAVVNTTPHYTDSRFKRPQTVWGCEEDGLGYDYNDRIWQWNWNKAKAAAKHADETAKPRTAWWHQEFLCFFFDKPIELKHILAGVNLSNGYPYCVYGYREAEQEGSHTTD